MKQISLTKRIFLTFGCMFATLVVALVLYVGFSARKVEGAFSLLVPFGGYLVSVDYETCDCGFVIFTVLDTTKKIEYRLIWFYPPQLFSGQGISLPLHLPSKIPGTDLPIPIPRVYLAAGPYFWAGKQVNVLGNFFPFEGASCLVISSTGCSVVSGAGDGYLVGIGSSLFPSK